MSATGTRPTTTTCRDLRPDDQLNLRHSRTSDQYVPVRVVRRREYEPLSTLGWLA